MRVKWQLLILCFLAVAGMENVEDETPTTTAKTTGETTTTAKTTGETTTTAKTTGETTTTASTTTAKTTGETTTTASTTTVKTTGATATTASTTSTTITTVAPGPCTSNPCASGSTCQDLLDSYMCLCMPGFVYSNNLCLLARSFPIDLILNRSYSGEMANKNSKEFKTTAAEIIKKLAEVLSAPESNGYERSTVLSLSPGSVIAEVENFFSVSSKIDGKTVALIINTAITDENEDGILNGASILIKSVCDKGYCDMTSTNCTAEGGLGTCICKEGYVKLPVTQQACISCPSGEKAEDSVNCVECPFGYSGFNCNESYLLILVVVSCVLGALFISTFIATIVLSSRKPKSTTKSLSNKAPNGDLDLQKTVGIPKIPRANANSGWQPTNLERTDSGSTNALVTRDRTDNRAFQDGRYDDYYNDMNGYRKPNSPRNGYRGTGVNDFSKPARNPYYDTDERMHRY